MVVRGGPRGQRMDLEDTINFIIGNVIEKHPRFFGQEEFLKSYIDRRMLNKDLMKYPSDSTDEDKIKFMNKLEEDITHGKFFDTKGKRIILRRGLKGYGRSRDYLKNWDIPKAISSFLHKKNFKEKISKGEDYLDRVTDSFHQLYGLMKTGDYADRMPELSEAVTDVNDAGFFDAAANVLYEGRLLNPSKYRTLKKAIHKKAKQGVRYTTKTIENYLTPQRITAGILGVLGIGILLASNTITGAVIGTGKTSLSALLFGGLTLIVGIFLWPKK